MEIKIKKMTLEDLEKIKENLQREFDDFWNYNILKQEIEKNNSCYIIAQSSEEKIIGFAGVQFVLEQADITNIVTKKSFINNGVGTKMLQELIQISKQRNMKNITLEVNEKNIYAIKLYKAFNFKEIGQRKRYYNGTDTAIIMELEI